jgi:hypothetical protein
MWSRRIELACGILGGALGLAALAVALFVPSDLICSSGTTSSPRGGCVRFSLLQQQGLANQALPIALFGGLSLALVLFTLWHTRSRSLPALALLWVCVALLTVATLRSLSSASSPGVLFIPADVLVLMASITGTLTARQRIAAPGMREKA